MIKHEHLGTTKSRDYKEAYEVYTKHYVFRGDVYPSEFSTPKGKNGAASYEKMWGPSEAYANGTMKDWNMVPRLREITTPCLVIAGEYDELTPKQAKITHNELPNSHLVIIPDASHCAHIEKEDEYLVAINEFLEELE